jgi:ribonuclease HII
MLLPFLHENVLEAGCDEAGRGCLAGPVFAAAVVLPPGFQHPLLNDSKQLTEANRDLTIVLHLLDKHRRRNKLEQRSYRGARIE